MPKLEIEYCQIEQIEEYMVICPYCKKLFTVDGNEIDIDFDSEIECPDCGEISLIPDF